MHITDEATITRLNALKAQLLEKKRKRQQQEQQRRLQLLQQQMQEVLRQKRDRKRQRHDPEYREKCLDAATRFAVKNATGHDPFSDPDLAINVLNAFCDSLEGETAPIERYDSHKQILEWASSIAQLCEAPKRFIQRLYQLLPIEAMLDEDNNTLLHYMLSQVSPNRGIVEQCILQTDDGVLLLRNNDNLSIANIATANGHDWAVDLLKTKIPDYSCKTEKFNVDSPIHRWYLIADNHYDSHHNGAGAGIASNDSSDESKLSPPSCK